MAPLPVIVADEGRLDRVRRLQREGYQRQRAQFHEVGNNEVASKDRRLRRNRLARERRAWRIAERRQVRNAINIFNLYISVKALPEI